MENRFRSAGAPLAAAVMASDEPVSRKALAAWLMGSPSGVVLSADTTWIWGPA